MEEVRIDKWLWAVRIFKTRTAASEACKKGRVLIGGTAVKPSRNIRVGEVIKVRKPPVTYSFKVLGLAEKRMGARLVSEYMENVTPPGSMSCWSLTGLRVRRSTKGTGRPKEGTARPGSVTDDIPEDLFNWDE